MIAIAVSELRMLLRNRLVASLAIAIPVILGVVFIVNRPGENGLAFASTLQVVIMLGMGVYITATTTLASRSQNLFLKRLRSGAVSHGAIIGGLVLPIGLVGLIQVAIITIALSVSESATPVHPWLIAVVVLLVDVMFIGFALATAGVTTSPEHAQVTTLPLFFASVAIPFWVVLTGTEQLGLLKNSLPGGAIPALMDTAWEGGDLGTAGLLLLPTIAWTAVAVIAAKIMFRWEPRR